MCPFLLLRLRRPEHLGRGPGGRVEPKRVGRRVGRRRSQRGGEPRPCGEPRVENPGVVKRDGGEPPRAAGAGAPCVARRRSEQRVDVRFAGAGLAPLLQCERADRCARREPARALDYEGEDSVSAGEREERAAPRRSDARLDRVLARLPLNVPSGARHEPGLEHLPCPCSRIRDRRRGPRRCQRCHRRGRRGARLLRPSAQRVQRSPLGEM